MKELTLSQGLVAQVDDDDYELLSTFKWSATQTPYTWYAYRKIQQDNVYLHRFIMNVTETQEVDHRDKNGLNCQRYNLRIASRIQNARYREVPQTEEGSGYRGVVKHGQRWRARIQVAPGERMALGLFDTPEEAAKVYDEAAKLYHGEFAVLNFP